MKRKSYLIVSILLFASLSCGKRTDKMEYISGPQLQKLVQQAVSGNKEANEKLSLYDPGMIPLPQSFDVSKVDSFKIDKNKYYYSLLQFPDPSFNRLAVYDNTGRLLLLDKSLNGDISVVLEESDGMQFLKAVESFISKDALSIKRLSFYKLSPASVKLVFRSYYSLVAPNEIYSQDITSFLKDKIITKLTLPSSMAESSAKADTFNYDASFGKYISRNNYFDEIIRHQVTDFNISKL
ncbi:MAG: hypothetical protein ACM3MI_04660 [Clostridiales bacterium]